MTFKEEIAALRNRIAKAESDRDTWRSSGMQEKYLEAYSHVTALELELERLRQQGLRGFVKDEPATERERLMAQYSITYNGRQYQYDRYRYDGLTDAVDYARLQRGRPVGSDGNTDPMAPAQAIVEAPDESQRELMAELAITFQDGIYHLGDYRYERLADAANYARLQRLQVRKR
jgi:hypothetical protein